MKGDVESCQSKAFWEKRRFVRSVLGKSSRVKFSTGADISKETLDYIHVDLWGPAQTISLGELGIYIFY